MCIIGGRLDDITAACEEAISRAGTNTLLSIHAGANDVMNTRSEEIAGEIQKAYLTV